jgi:maltose alpha-D-glucosyltransferase/alpha-amylase
MTMPPPDGQRNPQWYRDAIFYSLRVPAFYDANGDGIGDLRGLTEKLDYLQDLGVTALWLLPFYPSPLLDDGYDISNYTDVNPNVGTLADFKQFLKEAHRRGLKVVTELVLNHSSDQHPWFQRARRAKPGSPERDFYVWSDTTDRYTEARIIFKDFERSNWTWDPVANAYYWHRFYAHQPDLNFDNPAVKKALLRVLDFWLDLGVDGLRLDAVPYLFEREGTNCENLPETFAFLEELRAHIDRKYEDRMLLAEANQWPEDAVRYLEGGNKCQMAFHFPIMPRMFMALHMEDRFPITEIISQTPALPEGCQWGIFLRNHDELTLEMVTDEERDYMYEAYGKDPTARINLGIRRRLAPLLNNDRRKLELLNSLLFSLPGTPILYYGDEIGMGDNIHLGDRNGVRTPMQWSADRNAGFSRANPQKLYLPVIVDPEHHFQSVNVETQHANPSSLLWWTKRLIGLRKKYPVFGRGSCEFLDPGNPKVLAFIRELEDQRVLVVVNLSRFAQYVELDLSKFHGLVPVEIFGRTKFPPLRETPFALTPGPHAVFWFALERSKHEPSAIAEAQVRELDLDTTWANWVEAGDFSDLETLLPDCMQRRRWFGGKARALSAAVVRAALPLSASNVHVLFLVEVQYVEGSSESYHLPMSFLEGAAMDAVLEKDAGSVFARVYESGRTERSKPDGVLCDAFRSQDFCRSLMSLLQRRRPVKKGDLELRGELSPWLRKTPDFQSSTLEPRVLSVEQSNTSVIYGEQFILKLYRKAEAGAHPDLELGRFLTNTAQFPNAPRVAGWLEYGNGRGVATTLASLSEYASGCRDGWEYTRDELRRYFERGLAQGGEGAVPDWSVPLLADLDQEPPEAIGLALGTFTTFASLLGRRTAELHLALSSDRESASMRPESYGTLHQRSVYQSMQNLANQVLRELRRGLPGLPNEVRPEAEAILADERRIMGCFEKFRTRKIQAFRIRHHGDYHLGQVLYTGRDFLIIDFEGEPARSLADRQRKRSAIRDVAGMLRSFHYAAVSTLMGSFHAGRLNAGDREQLQAWADLWYLGVSRAFLKRYLETARGACFIPDDPVELGVLLDVFLMEKALYEVGYELNNRPSWLPIPLWGIRSVVRSANQNPETP